MSFHIIDKNPRKPRREGPKAQERYVEQLNAEWIDSHATKDQPPETPPEVPENVRKRYAEAEEITRKIMEEKGMFDAAPPAAIRLDDGTELPTEKVNLARRGDTLMRKAAWELRAFGRVREETAIEIENVAEALGIAPEDVIQHG